MGRDGTGTDHCPRTIGFPSSRLLSAPRCSLASSSLIQYTHARSPRPVCKPITPQHKQAAFVGRRLPSRGCPRAARVPLADNRQPRSCTSPDIAHSWPLRKASKQQHSLNINLRACACAGSRVGGPCLSPGTTTCFCQRQRRRPCPWLGGDGGASVVGSHHTALHRTLI